MGVPDGAREALTKFKVAGHRTDEGYVFWSNEVAAGRALAALYAAGYVVAKAGPAAAEPAESTIEYALGAMVDGEMKYRPAPLENARFAADAVRSIDKIAGVFQRTVGPWVPVSGEENKDG